MKLTLATSIFLFSFLSFAGGQSAYNKKKYSIMVSVLEQVKGEKRNFSFRMFLTTLNEDEFKSSYPNVEDGQYKVIIYHNTKKISEKKFKLRKLNELANIPNDSPDKTLFGSDAQLFFITEQKPDKAILYRGDEKVAESKLKENIDD